MDELSQPSHGDCFAEGADAAAKQLTARHRRLRRSSIVGPPLAILAAALQIGDPNFDPDDRITTDGGSGMGPRKGGW